MDILSILFFYLFNNNIPIFFLLINTSKHSIGLMAQWIARMTSDHKVGGSSPSGVEFLSN